MSGGLCATSLPRSSSHHRVIRQVRFQLGSSIVYPGDDDTLDNQHSDRIQVAETPAVRSIQKLDQPAPAVPHYHHQEQCASALTAANRQEQAHPALPAAQQAVQPMQAHPGIQQQEQKVQTLTPLFCQCPATSQDISCLVGDTLSVPIDLDQANFVATPRGLLRTFGPGTLVNLVCHAPDLQDDSHFDDWVYIACAVQYIRVAPQYKVPLYRRLMIYEGHTIRMSNYPTAFINGNQVSLMTLTKAWGKIEPNKLESSYYITMQVVLLSQLIHALETVGCNLVRVMGYGMKYRLRQGLLPYQVEEGLPEAVFNRWDIACSYPCGYIVLAKYQPPRPRHCSLWPMLLNIGGGFGTMMISYKIRFGQEVFKVNLKVYSTLIHVIKAIASHAGLKRSPGTIRLARTRISTMVMFCSHKSMFYT